MINFKLFKLSFLYINVFIMILEKKKIFKIFKHNICKELNNTALDYAYKAKLNNITH